MPMSPGGNDYSNPGYAPQHTELGGGLSTPVSAPTVPTVQAPNADTEFGITPGKTVGGVVSNGSRYTASGAVKGASGAVKGAVKGALSFLSIDWIDIMIGAIGVVLVLIGAWFAIDPDVSSIAKTAALAA